MAQKLRTPSAFPEGQSLFPSTCVRQFSTVCNFRRSDTHPGLCRHPTYIHMTQTSHKQTRNLFFLNDYFYIIKQSYLYYYVLFCGFLLFITAHILSVSSVDQLSIQWLYKYCNRINTTDLYLFSVMFKIL